MPESLLPQFLPINQHHRQARHALEMLVTGDEREITFQRGGRDERIHVTDYAGTLRRAERTTDVGVSVEHGIAQQQGRDFDEEFAEFSLALREVRITMQVFHDLAIAQDTRCDLSPPKPWANKRPCTPAAQ
jgi:hypothetical protein